MKMTLIFTYADKHLADGRLSFGTNVNGKRTRYILQGPIQKFNV